MERLKKIFDTKLKIFSFIFSAMWFILYFALGVAIFGKMWNTSPSLPIVGGVIAIIPIVLCLVNLLFLKNKIVDIGIITVSLIFSLGYFFIFAFILSKLNYFLITGVPYFIIVGILALIAFFTLVYPKIRKSLLQ